jgi:uncharacterized protein YbjT (DUF2867 family)
MSHLRTLSRHLDMTSQRVAVAGGTGLVGRYTVVALRAAGLEPVVLSRTSGVDLVTGAGLDEALAGVRSVIDVSNLTTMKAAESVAFFGAGTANLLTAGRRAGVAHHVALSIVGSDHVDLGYYLGKRRQEELLLAQQEVPVSILRATQFHEFPGQLIGPTPKPVVILPKMRTQPIAAVEVAQALTRLVEAAPVGLARDLAGPQPEDLADLARRLLRARHQRRLVVPVRLPGSAGRQLAGGGLLPAGVADHGRQTFAEWLELTGGLHQQPVGQ